MRFKNKQNEIYSDRSQNKVTFGEIMPETEHKAALGEGGDGDMYIDRVDNSIHLSIYGTLFNKCTRAKLVYFIDCYTPLEEFINSQPGNFPK